MKKITSLLIILILSLSALSGCFDPVEEATLRIGFMTGPTGMGMAELIHNHTADGAEGNYEFTKYTNTKNARDDLAAGKIDLICYPTNDAADYYAMIDNDVCVLAINCLNSLYYISSDKSEGENMTLSELEGSTVYTCKNGTPRIILEHLLAAAGVNATVSYTVDGKEMTTPDMVLAQLAAGNIPNATLPEPVITSAIIKTAQTDYPLSVKIDLGDEWNRLYDSPIAMGCVIARASFVKENKSLVDRFLDEYKASIEFIGNNANIDSAANYVVETEIMAAAPAAKKALLNLGSAIKYLDGEEMKNTLTAFYRALGITLPEDSFYYGN